MSTLQIKSSQEPVSTLLEREPLLHWNSTFFMTVSTRSRWKYNIGKKTTCGPSSDTFCTRTLSLSSPNFCTICGFDQQWNLKLTWLKTISIHLCLPNSTKSGHSGDSNQSKWQLLFINYIPLNHVTIVSVVCQIPLSKLLTMHFCHVYFTFYLNMAPHYITKYGQSGDKVAKEKVSRGSPRVVIYPFHCLSYYIKIMIGKFS